MEDNKSETAFRSTRWTLVGRAGGAQSKGGREALNELLQLYIPVLRNWLTRRRSMDAHAADDLLQDFVVSRILQKDLIEGASQGRGRFRSLLLKSLERFRIDQRRKRQTARRAPDRAPSLEDHRDNVPVDASPNNTFDAQWAGTVISGALQRLKADCDSKQGRSVWTVLVHRILAPLMTGGEPLSYAELQKLCNFNEPRQASNLLVTAKRSFARSLRFVIEDYSLDEEETDEEICELKRVLSSHTEVLSCIRLHGLLNDILGFEPSTQNTVAGPAIAALFDVDSARGARWNQSDVGPMVHDSLNQPLKKLVKVPRSHPQWKSRSARELFHCDAPPRELLKPVMQFGHSLINDLDEPIPSEVGAYFFLLAISTSVVKNSEKIANLPPTTLRSGVNRLLRRNWLDPRAANSFSEFLRTIPRSE